MTVQDEKHSISQDPIQLSLTRNLTAIVTDHGEVTRGLFSCLSAGCSCHKQHGLQSRERLGDGGGRPFKQTNDYRHSNKSAGQERMKDSRK